MRLAGLLLALLLAGAARAEDIVVTSVPLDFFAITEPSRASFGPLTFRGGLVMVSEARNFGGLSGVRLSADGGTLRAVSDRGSWFEAKIVYDGAKPTGIENAALHYMLGANGQRLTRLRSADAESLEVSETTAWVGVEGGHKIMRFDLSGGTASAKGNPIKLPAATANLPFNEGFEAIALVPDGLEKGALLAISESGSGVDGNHRAWLLSGQTKKPNRELAVKRRDGYWLTDAAFLPTGDLVVLERRFTPPIFLSMRLRRIRLDTIAEGAMLDGEVLLEASLPDQIDNMEGLSAHRAADGTSVVTLMSDNNFRGYQRNLLLQFGIAD